MTSAAYCLSVPQNLLRCGMNRICKSCEDEHGFAQGLRERNWTSEYYNEGSEPWKIEVFEDSGRLLQPLLAWIQSDCHRCQRQDLLGQHASARGRDLHTCEYSPEQRPLTGHALLCHLPSTVLCSSTASELFDVACRISWLVAPRVASGGHRGPLQRMCPCTSGDTTRCAFSFPIQRCIFRKLSYAGLKARKCSSIVVQSAKKCDFLQCCWVQMNGVCCAGV